MTDPCARGSKTAWRFLGIAAAVTTAFCAYAAPAFSADDRAVAYMESPGQWRLINESAWPQYPQARARSFAGIHGATYNITYLDVVTATGAGFDDPADGATRRATFDAVVAYIDSVIGDSGTVDIEVQVSQFDATGFLAAAGPFFFSGPDGFTNGTAFAHLTTGVDPSGAIPDINVTVDFGYTWNSGLGSPGVAEFDLFSVLLHEVTHGLGILSLALPSGGSAINENNPGVSGVFSVLDSLLELDAGAKDLYLPGGVINAVSADLISDDVIFTGPQATATFGSSPAIYSPSPFQSGSSISHWDLSVSATAVMPPSIAPAVEKRTYDPFELGALIDLGYSAPGATTTTSTVTSTSTTTTTLFPPVVCDPAPLGLCLDAARAKVQYDEKKTGKEKMKIQWKTLDAATTQAGFGDPVGGSTAVAMCVYNDGGTLVAEHRVNRAAALCAGKPCWKAKGTTGYAYKDQQNSADGVSKIGYKSGNAGKGKADAKGKNNATKGQTSLPTGVVALLNGQVTPTVQLLTSEGLCIGAAMNFVSKDNAVQYQAQKK